MKMTPLEPLQLLNLINTEQVYRAWLSTRRDVLATSLRRQASRNRRAGLGTIPPQVAQELRQSSRTGTAITSHHALHAYARLAATQLVMAKPSLPVTMMESDAAYPIVCIDQFGFALLLHVLNPVDYLAFANTEDAYVVGSMLDRNLIPPRFFPQIDS